MPPLGRRREDIPLLVSAFSGTSDGARRPRKIYSSNAIELLATTDCRGTCGSFFDLVKQNVALSHGNVMSKEFVREVLGRGPDDDSELRRGAG